MQSMSDESELMDFVGIFIILALAGGAVLLRSYFDAAALRVYFSIFLLMLTIFIIGIAYFRTRVKLSFAFVSWRFLLFTTSFAYMLSIIIYQWSTYSGSVLGIVMLLLLPIGMCCCGFLTRALEPKSNFRVGLMKGRFKDSSFSFNSAIWQGTVSDNNPVLLFFGFKTTKGDIHQSTFRKVGALSGVGTSIAISIQDNGGEIMVDILILVILSICFAYVYSFSYLADFVFWVRARFSLYQINMVNNRKQLMKELKSLGVPTESYTLSGELANDKYCLQERDGRWYVYYAERGRRLSEQEFIEEPAACQCLLEKLKRLI
ncbi:membrane hypothetical protein [Vibrio chagasii]|nr:membrane hypothetical protein [Vibrio chagasii]